MASVSSDVSQENPLLTTILCTPPIPSDPSALLTCPPWVTVQVLGEEFLFRGVLPPKMNGVFGKLDWVANGVLFGVYHLHQPWGMVTLITGSVSLLALPARRFRSTWMATIVHSGQSVFLLFLILGLVLGLA